MKYIADIKYYLTEDEVFQTSVCPPVEVSNKFMCLTTEGVLIIKAGWVWDGCSGPTYDDKTNMRAGCMHDALYYLMRNRMISRKWKPNADRDFKNIMKIDTVIVAEKSSKIKKWFYNSFGKVRDDFYWWGVENFGDASTDPKNKRPILEAP